MKEGGQTLLKSENAHKRGRVQFLLRGKSQCVHK